MTTSRQLVGRTIAALLLIVMAGACSVFGPDLHIDVENGGAKDVTVTVHTSALNLRGGEVVNVNVSARTGSGWKVKLGSTWDIKVDGKHVIGSGDRTDLALPSPGQRQDLTICIRVAADGTVKLVDC